MEFDGLLNVSVLKCETNEYLHDTKNIKFQLLPHRQQASSHYKDQPADVL
jgi:hypothetical protein